MCSTHCTATCTMCRATLTSAVPPTWRSRCSRPSLGTASPALQRPATRVSLISPPNTRQANALQTGCLSHWWVAQSDAQKITALPFIGGGRGLTRLNIFFMKFSQFCQCQDFRHVKLNSPSLNNCTGFLIRVNLSDARRRSCQSLDFLVQFLVNLVVDLECGRSATLLFSAIDF